MSSNKLPEATASNLSRELSFHTIIFHAAIADRLGLNATDHKALDLLDRVGPMTAGRLAEETGLTTGAITGVIDRLEQAGLVQRVKSPVDRRQVIIEMLPDRTPEIGCLFESLTKAMTG